MSYKENGGPAFPVPVPDAISHKTLADFERAAEGMSLRDYFAGEALPKVIGSVVPVGVPGWQDEAAWAAYSMADAMIRTRSKS